MIETTIKIIYDPSVVPVHPEIIKSDIRRILWLFYGCDVVCDENECQITEG